METKFDSVILAGGFGKRLSPLTDVLPKPMLPVAGVSAFERNLHLLRKHGFQKTAVTTMYLPEKIEALGDFGNSVRYFREETPLGSAGAVSKLKESISDCIIVISGDAVCDFDLKKAKEDFLKSGFDAAIVLCRTNDSGEYGSVCVCNGKITEFCEKPSVRDTLSDLINTGIYFISKKAVSLIPENKFFDFAKDLFPLMLSKGFSIGGIEPDGHWFDIGSFGAYHQCNLWISKGESCIGKQVSVHPSARIESCVIFDGCTIGNSVLRGCIVGNDVIIGNDCMIPTGCVIGPNAELRDGVALAPGTIVGRGETLLGEALVDTFPKPKQSLLLDDDAIIADCCDAGYFVKFGRLLGGEKNVIAFAQGDGMTLSQACEIACGVCEAGSNCTVISGGNAAMASFAAFEYKNKTAFIQEKDGQTEIRLFTPTGMAFSREALRELSSKAPSTSKKQGSVYLLPHGALVKRYILRLKNEIPLPKSISVASGRQNRFLREIADELGIESDVQDIKISLSDDGERAFAILPDGQEISYWQLLLICCIEGNKKGILLPRDTPDAVERILKHHSVDVGFYGDSESEERTLAESERLPRDGIMLALTAKAISEKKGRSISEMIRSLPPFMIVTRTVFADKDGMSSVISHIRERNGQGRVAAFEFGDGRVSVFASASGRFRLIAEAVDFETAEEISLRAEDLLEKEKENKKSRS